MKEFGRPAGRLASLELAARGIYSLWLVFALVHFASAFGMYWDRTLRDPPKPDASHLENVAVYYRGDGDLHYPKPFATLLEITHQHLFAMPVTLLVASHLYQMTRRSPREKRAVIAVSATAMVGHLAAPWVVRYGGSGWGWMMPATGLPFGLGLAWMTILPLRDMWLGGRPRASSPEAET